MFKESKGLNTQRVPILDGTKLFGWGMFKNLKAVCSDLNGSMLDCFFHMGIR